MLVASESFVNLDKGHSYGESGWQECWTDDVGQLYRSASREFGRCVGHVYVDTPTGRTVPVGWVFHKRVEYDDAHRITRGPKTYLREVWLSVGHRADDEDSDGGVVRYDVVRKRVDQ